MLAELYALTGRRQEALAMFERSKLKKRRPSNLLAVAQLALGNKEEALRLLESAVERAYKNISKLRSLGSYYRPDIGQSLWPPGHL